MSDPKPVMLRVLRHAKIHEGTLERNDQVQVGYTHIRVNGVLTPDVMIPWVNVRVRTNQLTEGDNPIAELIGDPVDRPSPILPPVAPPRLELAQSERTPLVLSRKDRRGK